MAETATPVWMVSDLIMRLTEILAESGDMIVYVRHEANKRPHHPITSVNPDMITEPPHSRVTSLAELLLTGNASRQVEGGEIIPAVVLTI